MNHQDHQVQEGNAALEPVSPEIDAIGKAVVDAAWQVYKRMGPGLLESAYEACMFFELTRRGYRVERQVEIKINYDGNTIDCGYRLDLLVNGCIIVEIKATTEHHEVFEAQLLSYLKLSNLRLGYLINFHRASFKNAVKRMVL